ncbi:MAG: hypothetical protein CL902_00895, partial [Dehalococcoidia bacterium]|nr:hypothetical protein [Dehalococcoidia bacterium]
MIEAISSAIVDPIKESTNRPETIRAILQVKMPEEDDEEAGSGPYRRWRRLGLAVAMLKCRLMADNAMDYFGVVTDGDTARSWKQITGTMQHMFGMLHADTAIAALLGDDAVAQDHTSEFAWMRTDLLVDPAGLNHRQRLILYLLHRAAATEGGLRRDGETLYKQRWTQRVRCLDRCTVCGEGMADHPTDILSRRSHVFRPTFEVVEGSQWTRTYAWVPLAAETRTEDASGVPRVQHGDSTIRTFIKTECSKDRCFDAWSDLTKSGGDEESAVRYLSGALDNELPLLERSEGLFAFVNGIYDADTDKFHPFYDAAGNPAPVPIGDRCVYQYYQHWMPWDEIEAETDGPKKRNRESVLTCRHCQQPLHRHRTARCTTPEPEPCSSTTETRRCDEAWRSIKTP